MFNFFNNNDQPTRKELVAYIRKQEQALELYRLNDEQNATLIKKMNELNNLYEEEMTKWKVLAKQYELVAINATNLVQEQGEKLDELMAMYMAATVISMN